MPCPELRDLDRFDGKSIPDSEIAEAISYFVELGLVRELPDGLYEPTEVGRKVARGLKMYERYKHQEPSMPPEPDQWLEVLRLLEELPHDPNCDCEQSSMPLSGWTDDGLYLIVRNSVRLVMLLEKDGDALRLVV